MSAFGVPPEISALQSVQAQREAAKARDRTRAAIERKRTTREEEERFRVHDTAEISDARRLDEESSQGDDGSRRQREADRHADRKQATRTNDGDGHIDYEEFSTILLNQDAGDHERVQVTKVKRKIATHAKKDVRLGASADESKDSAH